MSKSPMLSLISNFTSLSGMSVYNVVILSVLGVAITSVIREHQNATFAITAVFTIFCTTLTLCFVFLPKVSNHPLPHRNFLCSLINKDGGWGTVVTNYANLLLHLNELFFPPVLTLKTIFEIFHSPSIRRIVIVFQETRGIYRLGGGK